MTWKPRDSRPISRFFYVLPSGMLKPVKSSSSPSPSMEMEILWHTKKPW